MVIASDELALMRSPLRGYERLASRGGFGPLTWRFVAFALALGLAASCSLAGAPLLSHWLLCSLAWSFVPLLQLASGFAIASLLGRGGEARAVLELHFAGNGPPLLAALFAAGWSLLPLQGAALRYGPIVAAGLMAILYGAVIHAGFYRVVLERPRERAIAWVLAEWLLRIALILGWFAVMNNLAPQFLGRR